MSDHHGGWGGAADGGAAAAAPGWYPLPDGRTAWWDGTQWLQQPPLAPTEPYRAIGGLGTATTVLLAGSGLLALAVFATELNRTLVVNRIIGGSGATLDQANAADDLAVAASTFAVLAMLVTGIVLLLWLNRVFKNLHGALRGGKLEYSSGWAVGWWFVPFANFVKPKQVMNEAWVASAPGTTDPSVPISSGERRTAPPLLSWWWGTWLSAAIVTRIGSGIANPEATPESLRTGFAFRSIGGALYVVAAVLAIQVVRGITQRQEQRARNLAARSTWGA